MNGQAGLRLADRAEIQTGLAAYCRLATGRDESPLNPLGGQPAAVPA